MPSDILHMADQDLAGHIALWRHGMNDMPVVYCWVNCSYVALAGNDNLDCQILTYPM